MKRKKLRRLRILLVLLLTWLLIHILYQCYDGLHDYRGKADIAVVLGNYVYPNGQLSRILASRVERSYQLYKAGQVKWIMVSGGGGKNYDRPGIPEGTAMKEYLVVRGVPANRIIVDNNGDNTYLTAEDFLPVADSLHCESAIAVSSFYHITRTKYIIRKVGFKNVHSASSHDFYSSDFYGIFRDCIAFYKYVLVY
jgi:vancomycin permeability regulator SanA